LDDNKNNKDLLIKAANYKNKYNYTSLHYLLMNKPPSDLVKRLLQLAPNTIKVQDYDGVLPIHIALRNKASDDVITMLFQAYPEASEIQNKNGEFSFDIALCNDASDKV
jgi:ankyrin repeat protein